MEVNSSTHGGPRTPPYSPDSPPSNAQPSQTPPYKPSTSPINNATSVHNSNVASLLSREKTCSSPEPNCSICLGKLENKSFTNGCLHMFCFSCLLQWSKIKAECPLCKQSFKSIIHNVRSMQEYDEYQVQVAAAEPFVPLNHYQLPYHDFMSTIQLQTLNGRHHVGIPFRYSTTMSTRRYDSRVYTRVELEDWVLPSQRSRGWRQHRRHGPNNDFRNSIYVRDVWAVPPADIMERVRDCSPAFYTLNPAQIHRLVPWLNRELNALLGPTTASCVLDLIIRSITQYEIQSPEFRQLLRLHLGGRTDHFVHEFQSFASSHFDLIGYDQGVTYVPNPTLSSLSPIDLVDDDSSSSDSDVLIVSVDEAVAGPSGVNSIRPAHTQSNLANTAAAVANDDDDSEDCMIVQCVKPRHERTPEIIELSSEDEQVDVEQTQANECLDEFPMITDFELDSEELDTLMLDDLVSCSSSGSSSGSTTCSEYRPRNVPMKRKAPKKEKVSSKSLVPKKTESRGGKLDCKSCTRRKSHSVSVEKGKGKRHKCEKHSKPTATATRSTSVDEPRRHRHPESRTNSSAAAKRARREDSSADRNSEREHTLLVNRLQELSPTQSRRLNKRRVSSSSDDKPLASFASVPGPSRRQTRQHSSDVAQASNWANRYLVRSSSEDEETAKKATKRSRKKSHSRGSKRSRHKKTSGESESGVKTSRTSKEQVGNDSRKGRTDAVKSSVLIRESIVDSSSSDCLDAVTMPIIENSHIFNHHRNINDVPSSSYMSPTYRASDSSVSGGESVTNVSRSSPALVCSNSNTRKRKAIPHLQTINSGSSDELDHPRVGSNIPFNSDRSSGSGDLRQWSSPSKSRSSSIVISSPNVSVNSTVANERSTSPSYLDPYCTSRLNLFNNRATYTSFYGSPSNPVPTQDERGTFTSFYGIACPPIPTQDEMGTFESNPVCERDNLRCSTDTNEGARERSSRHGNRHEENVDERPPENNVDTWTILKAPTTAEEDDDSSTDSDDRPRLKSIVITRSNNQRSRRERSVTPDCVSVPAARTSHLHKKYSKHSSKRKRQSSSESSVEGRSYVKWNRKRYSDSEESTTS